MWFIHLRIGFLPSPEILYTEIYYAHKFFDYRYLIHLPLHIVTIHEMTTPMMQYHKCKADSLQMYDLDT